MAVDLCSAFATRADLAQRAERNAALALGRALADIPNVLRGRVERPDAAIIRERA